MNDRVQPLKPRIYTVATAHLDTSWNWTLETTIREYIPATLRENFALFEKYPDYTFSFEGTYRYELMEEYYPEDFEQLKGYIAAGRWYVTGSAYENGDSNIPSPEALFRNILYGNDYFDRKFGKRSVDIYLPDCFGFGWALPSVAAHANLKGFATQKLPWSSAVGIPFDLGRWVGVDGHDIYAALNACDYITTFTQVRENKVIEQKLAENIAQHDLPFTLHLHGVGDRGGAPKELSVQTVCDELKQNSSEAVDVLSAPADQVFRDMDTLLTPEQKEKLPVWNTDLVSTNHGVGGYTSRAIGKRWNRRGEQLADAAERFACAAGWMGASVYPEQRFDTAWKRLIAHQFHDDIPGTSLAECYQRNWNDYMLSINELAEEYRAAAGSTAAQMDLSFAKGSVFVVTNPLQFTRQEAVTVAIPGDAAFVRVFDSNGKETPAQAAKTPDGKPAVTFLAQVPGLGLAAYDVRPSQTPCKLETGLRVTTRSLENETYRVALDPNGDVVSIWDKKLDRGLLEKPIRMALHAYLGSGTYPAWELNYKEVMAHPKAYAASPEFTVTENGPARVSVRTKRTACGSTFYQTISLTAGGLAVEFQNEILWESGRTLLKTEFPLLAQNEQASYDLGLGVIKRGTNTPLLYEVPAQMWADLTDQSGAFGVSILSDSKIGWDKPDNHTLRLTGMHTPVSDFHPENKQSTMELGLNRYGFAVYSHAGGYDNGTQREAAAFNQPLAAFKVEKHAGILPPSWSFGVINHEAVILRAVKKAIRSDEIIVRVNEGSGEPIENVRLSLGGGIASARAVYASEEDCAQPVAVENGTLVFSIGAFEPKTFALTLLPFEKEAAKPAYFPVTLSYDRDIVSANSRRGDGEMPNGEALPAEQFPETLLCGGVPFETGPIEDGRCNAVTCMGQTLKIPAGATRLHLVVASFTGDKISVLTTENNQTLPFAIQDAEERVGAWDLYGLNETGWIKRGVLAWNSTHTHLKTGDLPAKQTYFFRCDVDLPEGTKKIRLPCDMGILLLAATASTEEAKAETATDLYDRLEKRPFTYKRPLSDQILSAQPRLWEIYDLIRLGNPAKRSEKIRKMAEKLEKK